MAVASQPAGALRADRIRRRLALMLGLLTLVSLVVLALMLSVWDVEPGTLELEIGRSLLQVIVVAVIGTTLTVLVGDHQRGVQEAARAEELARQRLEHDREVLRSVLDDATRSYNGVKRARRLLRALARSSAEPSGGVVLAAPYEAQMLAINDHQLALETLAGRLKTTTELFGDRPELQMSVRSLERYLGHLITEFEGARAVFSGEPPSCALCRLPVLAAFIGKGAFDDFSDPFHALQARLRADLQATYEAPPRP